MKLHPSPVLPALVAILATATACGATGETSVQANGPGGGTVSSTAHAYTGTELSLPRGYEHRLHDAAESYGEYVRSQTADLVSETSDFADAYKSGDTTRARDLYTSARAHWERIKPVAESLSDLSSKLDARAADLGPGQTWTGWHRIEKDLWAPEGYKPLTPAQRDALAQALVADTKTLAERVSTMEFTAEQIARGATEMVDEVASSRLAGEEEAWSHTDLYDVQAEIDGAREAFVDLHPVLELTDPELASLIGGRFTVVQDDLDRYRSGDGFVPFTALSEPQVQRLTYQVNSLAEQLSRMTSTVTL